MMQRKPVKLVAIALANRLARTVWALLKTGESYISGFARLRKEHGPDWSDEMVRRKWDDGELTDNRIGTPRSDRSAS